MKVDKNTSIYSAISVTSGNNGASTITKYGIPLRLEIASRLLASLVAARGFVVITEYSFLCGASLELADKLIECHNKTCEGEK